jgi:hypothetical protein
MGNTVLQPINLPYGSMSNNSEIDNDINEYDEGMGDDFLGFVG